MYPAPGPAAQEAQPAAAQAVQTAAEQDAPGPAQPGARFSKVPVTTGPINLPGLLPGFFFGPAVAFLEELINLPDIYRAR